MIKKKEFYISVDGGATKTKVSIFNHIGEALGVATGRASSLNLGINHAWESIVDTCKNALQASGLDRELTKDAKLITALAGTRATGRVEEFKKNTPNFFTAPPQVITDGHAAMIGALGGKSGALIILGTGAVGHALYPDGKMAIAGGWSFPVADFGSGAWLGLKLGGITMRWMDLPEPRPSNPLAEALTAKISKDPLVLQSWFSEAKSTEYASLAPIVLNMARENDKAALNLISRCVLEAGELCKSLEAHGKIERVSALGGISKYIGSELKNYFKERWHDPEHDATFGGYLVSSGKAPDEKLQ